ncbi:ATP-binding protein [Brevundimonas sp. SPF441]|uniref:ATP-binding protein n=1 Tax=Brevundimonas sp. SPF441 TaxID=2663795 RepID=UPI00129E8197|nr:ATP-binding protein [Brevundimonas sp. SPF441]MRL70015.1 ATP-binding protein [Brevundimonas sp. SPF441]
MTTENIETLPDPERMIEGLRDTGYKFNTAIADIIDNSIAAKATYVDLQVVMDMRDNIRVSIADNGDGMDREGILNAMTYGSRRRADPSSLGKFGLGLKTASTAFSRVLSVVSRPSAGGPVLQATWDLGHVAKHGWNVQLTDEVDEEALDHLNQAAPAHSGTVVLWTRVDRLIKQTGGNAAQNALNKTVKALREHVGMVFQRFLDPADGRAPNVEIRINDEKVHAWDPFCVAVSDKVVDQTVDLETSDGRKARFIFRAYILPRKEEFESDLAFKKSRLGNEAQGMYIYRENRLIQEATWLGMYTKEPHGSLLRVEFSFTHELDEVFDIDFKKSQISLNEDLWIALRDQFLTAPRREANKRYRQGRKADASKKAQGAHDSSNRAIAAKEGALDNTRIGEPDPKTGDAELTNAQGSFRIKINFGTAQRPGEVHVQTVDSLDDGALFEPGIIDGHKAVRINTSHPYYNKVYIPNLAQGVTVQGMDSLLWGLCLAELSTISESTAEHFEQMRYEVSRILRKLVEDLPEPEMDDVAG